MKYNNSRDVINKYRKVITWQVMVIFCYLFVSLAVAQDKGEITRVPLWSTSNWIPQERKLICLEMRCSKPAVEGRAIILDTNRKTFHSVKIPHFIPHFGFQNIPYIKDTKEILLKGGSTDKNDFRVVKFKPFSERPVIRTLFYISDGSSRDMATDMELFHRYLIFVHSYFGEWNKYKSLVAYDMDKKTSFTLRSDVRSDNLVYTPSGNLYFLTEKGIQRFTTNINRAETVLNPFKVKGLTISRSDWEKSNLINFYISPDESVLLIQMSFLDLETYSEIKPTLLYSFDLTKKICLNKINCWSSNFVFPPDSRKILIASPKGIDVYDTSLNKLSILINSPGKIVPCGNLGFVLFKKRLEEDKPKSSESSYPYEFLMYNWEGKLVFKFSETGSDYRKH